MDISVTLVLIIGTCIFSIAAFSRPQMIARFIWSPYLAKQRNEWHRVLSSGFLHADYGHLAFNMIALYFFGGVIESLLSPIHLVAVLLVGIVVGNMVSYPKYSDTPYYKALGASGGVAAVLFCSIIFRPTQGIGLIFIPGIYIPAFIFAPLYLIYSYYQGKRGMDNIGHDAHLYGALSGVAYAFFANPSEALLFIDKIIHSINNGGLF